MSFGAIGVEIMAKIKIMRVVIGFTKKKKGKEVIIMLKKKLVQVTAAMAATMLFSVPAMAKKNFFSFNVKTSVNDGEAFSAGNPKNDAERQAYVVTQDSNIISTDAFYYAVFNYPKDTARYQYAYHTKMSSRTGTVHPQYYKSVTAGQTMYLQADTDKYIVWADGYWFS